MAAIGRRPQVLKTDAELLLFWSEGASQTFPSMTGSFLNPADLTILTTDQPVPQEAGLRSPNVWPIGTRLTYMRAQTRDISVPTPVMILNNNATSKASPWDAYPLHNATDFTVTFEQKTQQFHCFWYWNGWSDDQQTLPAPPTDWYAPHSVPSVDSPPWLRSLVPNVDPPTFDMTRTFWIAPIVDHYRYDYFAGQPDSVKIGESRVNSAIRMPDSPGARKLQQLIDKKLISFPAPDEPDFDAKPSLARLAWELSGGIVGAGRHIRIASQRDNPIYVPSAVTGQPSELPDADQIIPANATIEDHLIIVQALKAHFDHRNISKASRVLMYSTGVLTDLNLTTIPSYFVDKEANRQSEKWPHIELSVDYAPFLLLLPPTPIGDFSVKSNYQLTINPTVVTYPVIGGAAPTFYPNQDGFVLSTSTPDISLEPALDYTVHDPTPAWAKNASYYRTHYQLGSV